MPEAPLTPPRTRVEPVDELFHGEHVPDPYRWLEDGDAAEVRDWTEAQNGYTRGVLGSMPARAAIRAELAELLSIGTVGVPEVRNGRCFYERRDGSQNQPVLYLRQGPDGDDRVLLDPNALSAGGTVALDYWYPSRDGRLLAYGISADGSELSTLHVLDVESGETRTDAIPRARHASVAFLPDNSGFYYTRLPTPDEVPAGEEQYHRTVRLHRIGEDPAADQLIWSERRDMRESPWVQLSKDGRWLLVTATLGWDRCDVYLRDLSRSDADWSMVFEGERALFSGVIEGNTLYGFTNLDAPRYRVVSVPLDDPRRERWREVVPERPDATLQSGAVAGGRLALLYLVDATSCVELRSLDGELVRELSLPGLGTVSTLNAESGGDELFFDFVSFTAPVTIFRLDLRSGALSTWAQVPSPVDADEITVEQLWYDSTDGARVSMFVARPRVAVLDGNNPVLLTGYGGFNISRTPQFAAGIAFWLRHGGIYVLPNLRGGSEYGEDWHRGGMLEQKQHTFDDFIAAARLLIGNGYTSADRLAILGGSNGGLLVGAAITQQPALFRAAVCQVPLLDMLRYHQFLIARLWIAEYGSAEDAEQYRWLRAYSPYHQVRQSVHYPAVLFTAAISDSRVDPLHARKMAALLQARQAASPDERPVLLRIETRAGHGQGKPLAKVLDEQTDIWSFVCGQLGIPGIPM
ncbi:MAG: prolyl oligopeptidase family serine peptidase [Dehalococcoidia bacterium]